MKLSQVNLLFINETSRKHHNIQDVFDNNGIKVLTINAHTREEVCAAFAQKNFDIVISTDDFFDLDTAHPISIVRNIDKEIPIIHLETNQSSTTKELAKKLGATEIITTENLSELVTCLKQVITRKNIASNQIDTTKTSRNIVHDINNVIASASMSLHTIKEQSYGKIEIEKHAKKIENAFSRIMNLSRQLLETSPSDSSTFETLNSNEILRNFSLELGGFFDNSIKIKLILSGHAPTLLGNKTKIEQLLYNLSFNARDAMPKGGVLTLKTDATTAYCIFTISDTGKGISEENIVKIFDSNFTTKTLPYRTGLGLAIVKEIVENHNGKIEVTSQINMGTTFSIYFPR